MPAPGRARPGTGPKPTGCGPRSRPPAGRSSTAARTSRSRPRRPRMSPRAIGSATGRARACRHGWTSRRSGVATVVLVATDWPDDLARTLAGLRAASPAGTSVVIVADGPSSEQEHALRALEAGAPTAPVDAEPCPSRSSGRASGSATRPRRTSGCDGRRARSSILLDTSVEPTGDIVTPLVRALDDPTVAVAGRVGDRVRATCASSRTRRPATSTRSRATARRSAARTSPLAARSTSTSGSTATSTSGGASSSATTGEGGRRAGPSASTACRSCATSTAATPACPRPSATARASATSTGSSTASGTAGTCSTRPG